MSFKYADAGETLVETPTGVVPLNRFLIEHRDDPNGVPSIEPYQKYASAEQARAELAEKVLAHCETLIVGGLVSAALGAPHTYPSKVIDQQNLAANVQRSTLPINASDPNWITWHMCADVSGAWQFRPHTAAQIQAVGEDLANIITLIRMANATKIAELEGLSIAELEVYDVAGGWPL